MAPAAGLPDCETSSRLHRARPEETADDDASGARDYAESVATRVVLIDGTRLADLMIRHGVGVQVRRTVEIVEVDEDFFE